MPCTRRVRKGSARRRDRVANPREPAVPRKERADPDGYASLPTGHAQRSLQPSAEQNVVDPTMTARPQRGRQDGQQEASDRGGAEQQSGEVPHRPPAYRLAPHLRRPLLCPSMWPDRLRFRRQIGHIGGTCDDPLHVVRDGLLECILHRLHPSRARCAGGATARSAVGFPRRASDRQRRPSGFHWRSRSATSPDRVICRPTR